MRPPFRRYEVLSAIDVTKTSEVDHVDETQDVAVSLDVPATAGVARQLA
jgi:hypothetical protein